jgi:hypothetical protein
MGGPGIHDGDRWWRRTVLWLAFACGLIVLLPPGSAIAAETPSFDAHGSIPVPTGIWQRLPFRTR